jgi:transposase
LLEAQKGGLAVSQSSPITAGLDLGDRYIYLCLLGTESGEVLEEGRISTTPKALQRRFSGCETMRIAIEAGTHSPWVSRLLKDLGHEVLVANARKPKLIYAEGRKNDRLDAQNLARLARLDKKLLSPLKHRGETSQAHLAIVRSREALIQARAKLINHVRGTVKSFGSRLLPQCSSPTFHKKAEAHVPEPLRPALEPLLKTIASMTESIQEYDRELEVLAEESYPEAKLLKRIHGIGTLTALTFVLTLEDPSRFGTGRTVGAYLGLVPGKDQSGERDPQKRISKQGNGLLRKLLVGSAHRRILGPFGEDCDLRRHGLKICERGGRNAKKRAVVAVARKLSVLLHRLWVTGEVYEPLYNAKRSEGRAA